MTQDQVTQWIRHRRLQTWLRWVLAAAWVGAFCLVIADSRSDVCMPDDPSICGHPPTEASIALTLLTPILLVMTPRAGYVTALVSGICELGWDVGVARMAFSVAAGFVLAGGALIGWSRSRQRALAAAAEHASVASSASTREQPGRRWRRVAPVIAAGVLGVSAVACTVWYVHDVTALARREGRASSELAEIVRVDDQGRIFVSLDPSIGIPVTDSSRYAVGTSVWVLDTPDGGRLWIRPMAEPEDATSPLMFAVGLATVVVLLVAGRVQRSRAHRRLVHATDGIPLVVTLGARGIAAIRATPGGSEMARIRLERRGDRGSAEQPEMTRREAYQPQGYEPGAWRPRGSEPAAPPAVVGGPTSAALVGDFVIDGWAGLVVDQALLLPRRRVRGVRVHHSN